MNKFLVIQTAFIGDVILATAMLENLHLAYPNAQIDVLVRKGNEVLFDEHPYINQVFVWDKKKKYKNLVKLIKLIRKEKYDLTVNLQRFFSSGLITLFTKSKVKIGYKSNPLSIFFSKRYEHDLNSQKHEIERNHQLIEPYVNQEVSMPKLYPLKKHFDKINSLELPSNFSVAAPSSVWETKKLPKHKFLELFNNNSSTNFVLIGAPSDFEYCEQIQKESNNLNIINLAGKLNLLESTALISLAKMNYVNDSAPLHLASATNSPVTAFFCSTIPEFGFGPLSENQSIKQVSQKLSCRPCGLHGKKSCPLKHFKCGNDIKVID